MWVTVPNALAVEQRLEGVRVRVHHQADDDHVVAGGDELTGPADEPLALARESGRVIIHVPGHARELVGPFLANAVARAC